MSCLLVPWQLLLLPDLLLSRWGTVHQEWTQPVGFHGTGLPRNLGSQHAVMLIAMTDVRQSEKGLTTDACLMCCCPRRRVTEGELKEGKQAVGKETHVPKQIYRNKENDWRHGNWRKCIHCHVKLLDMKLLHLWPHIIKTEDKSELIEQAADYAACLTEADKKWQHCKHIHAYLSI